MNILRAQSNTGLSDNDIHRVAPSVFATEPWEGVSDAYAFIPTATIVSEMRNAGLVPVSAQQSVVRISGKRDYAKHMLRFRRQQDVDAFPRVVNGNQHHFYTEQPTIAEVVLTNSHDRSSAFNLAAGLFRLVCSNGLMISASTLDSIRVRHVGAGGGEVIEGAYRIVDEFPVVMQQVEQWQHQSLTDRQQLAFATAAATLRWDDHAPVRPQQLLAARRDVDDKPDLWTTFNRVQENMAKGGLRGRTQTNKRMTTRGINSVTEDTKLNKALWTLAEELSKSVN